LAQIGCNDAEIMSITGHTKRKEVDRYTKGARQLRLAENVLVRMKTASEQLEIPTPRKPFQPLI